MVSLAKLHKYFEMSKKDLKIQESKDLNIQKFKLFSAKMAVVLSHLLFGTEFVLCAAELRCESRWDVTCI